MRSDVCIALIPAYQPGYEFPSFTAALCRAGFLTVIVDDGSGADYQEIFTEVSAYALVIHHDQNRGKGAALKTGLSYIHDNLCFKSIVITIDADGQHKIEDAITVCEEASHHQDALTLGCRHFTGNVPLRSRFGNSVTRAVFRMATGVGIYDTQTGLRAFSTDLIPELLSINGERYDYEMNVLLSFARKKQPICQTEISTIYENGNASSHFRAIRDSALIYGGILKFAASSFIGFLTDYGMFTVLSALTGGLGASGIVLSNIGARVVSATVNFTINKKFVFKNKDSVAKTAVAYFALAACILAGNTALLTFLVEVVLVNRYIAKLFTEIIFFTLSYLVQKFWIFRKKEGNLSDRLSGRCLSGNRQLADKVWTK